MTRPGSEKPPARQSSEPAPALSADRRQSPRGVPGRGRGRSRSSRNNNNPSPSPSPSSSSGIQRRPGLAGNRDLANSRRR